MTSLLHITIHTAVLIFFAIGVSNVEASDNSGGCVYSFEVWRPNQDILNQMQSIKSRCDNTSRYVSQELLVLKNDILKELLNGRNLTHKVEKEILEQKLEGVQNKIALQDMQFRLEEVKGISDKLNKAQTQFDQIVAKIQGELSEPVKDIIKRETAEVQDLVAQLKNSVGDLKAEWTLIKREVNDVKVENQAVGQMKSEYANHMSTVAAIQNENNKLKDDLKSLSGKFKRHIHDLRKGVGDGTTAIETGVAAGLKQQISDIRKSNDKLHSVVHHLKRQNSRLKRELKRELMSVLLSLGNVSEHDVTLILKGLSVKVPPVDAPSTKVIAKGESDIAVCAAFDASVLIMIKFTIVETNYNY